MHVGSSAITSLPHHLVVQPLYLFPSITHLRGQCSVLGRGRGHEDVVHGIHDFLWGAQLGAVDLGYHTLQLLHRGAGAGFHDVIILRLHLTDKQRLVDLRILKK